ncbi:MAG: ABC transporter ATP-binding protein [Candidatus Izemoplasmatales bacterium]
MAFIEFKHVSKAYNEGDYVIDDLSFEIPKEEFVTILGPSGCGKTTLLKMVNKMIPYDKGDIYFNDKNLAEWDKIKLRRSIGYVIQQIGLMPHLTVEKNITYVLDITNSDKSLRKGKAEELIELVGLSKDLLNRYPRELSGGQQQRVGVARALAADPDIILMDEPFGAVDEIARTTLQDEIVELQKKLKKTILFVTHDIQEAFKLGSTIILMNKGKIIQIGTKEDLVFKPKNDFVKEFLGIKGFQATLDKKSIADFYERVLNEEVDVNVLYERMKK